MGLYDTVSGLVECPYCGTESFVSFQTKGLVCEMLSYYPGSTVSGGPYLNGEYGRHLIACDRCGHKYLPVFRLRDQVIEALKAYREEDIPACSHLPEDARAVDPQALSASILAQLIVRNIVVILTLEQDVVRAGEFTYARILEKGFDPEHDALGGERFGRQIARVWDFLRLLAQCDTFDRNLEECTLRLGESKLHEELGEARRFLPWLDDINLEALAETLLPALPVAREMLSRFSAICRSKHRAEVD